MPPSTALARQILDTIYTQLIPRASGGAPFVLFGAPPRMIGKVAVTERSGDVLPLKRGEGQPVRVQTWRQENLNATTIPYLGCVVEGEADIVTGTTAAMCRSLKIPGKRWVVHAPQKTFFLVPPQIPVSRGARPHWERAHPEEAYSRILWLQFNVTGADCHFCTSGQGRHWTHPHHFAYGKEFFPTAQALIREMTAQSNQYVPLVYHNLGILLHQMVRSLSVVQAPEEQGSPGVAMAMQFHSTDIVVQRAIDYIDQRIDDKALKAEHIAEHLHISARQLARIFHREMGVALMKFVATRRMEFARQLLLESSFNTRRIAHAIGYTSSSSFVKTFQHYYGESPTEYRLKNRLDGEIEQ